MKKNNRKGFTIVELVIVIAVIAILAAVLIPTFSGITKKANDSAITQETRAAVTVLLAEKNGQIPANTYFAYQKQGSDAAAVWFKYEGGTLVAVASAPIYAASDEVFAQQAALDIIKSGEATITIAADGAKGAVLADLSANVEILIDNP